MANSRQYASGLSSFIQAFSAVDAVGSRRRQEKKLDERLEDEREFRAKQLEFAQNREDRAEELHDESFEEKELRLEADRIALDPSSTEEQLREAALRSPMANEKLEYNRQLGAFVGLTDAALARQQTAAAQAGATEEAALVTAQQSGLSDKTPVGELPSDPRVTRSISIEEIESQAGQKAPVGDPRRINAIDMPLDWKTQDEINAMSDKQAAQTIRDRQTAEARELLEGDLSSVAQNKARERTDSEREILDNSWNAISTVSETSGDHDRKLYLDNPTMGVNDYHQNRSTLSKNVREKADIFMAPVAEQARKEQWAILSDPEMDPTSRDYSNARRKFNQAIRVGNAIALSVDSARKGGIKTSGLPPDQMELAEPLREAAIAAPKLPTTLPSTKERQIAAQEARLTANPAKRLSRTQINNIFLGAQAGYFTMDSALYRATHGGAPPPGEVETFSHDPKKDLYVKYPGGIQLVRPARDPDFDGNESARNLLETAGSDIVNDYFDQFNTEDDETRGAGYKFAALGIMGRVEDRANEEGYAYSNPLDVQRLLTRITQTVLIKERFNEQWMIGTDWQPEFSEYFKSIEDAIFDPRLDKFRGEKAGEFFDDFEGLDLQPLGGGDGDRITRFQQALISSNDPRAKIVSQMSDEQKLAFMKQEAAAGR